MTTRLTPATEAAIRARHANHTSTLWHLHAHRDIGALLEELAAVRAELAAAEQRGREAIASWLRDDGGDVFIREYNRDVPGYKPSLGEAMDWGCAALAAAVERGDHLQATGAAEVDGGDSQH
jgi:hypothetical protein